MPNRPSLVVLVGLPGSGKSTQAARLVEREYPQALVLSSDDIRWTMNFVDGSHKQYAEVYVRGVIENYVRGCIAYGRSVIVDATNLTRDHRRELLYCAYANDVETVCVYIRCSPTESARRSAKWIKAADIDAMFARFEEPTKEEGWNRLVVIDGERRT